MGAGGEIRHTHGPEPRRWWWGGAKRRTRDALMVSVFLVVTDLHHQHKHKTSVELRVALVQLQVVQLRLSVPLGGTERGTRLPNRSDTNSRAQQIS